eukprot:Platyproteum_vivax@DN7618_c0_g1_i4.p1
MWPGHFDQERSYNENPKYSKKKQVHIEYIRIGRMVDQDKPDKWSAESINKNLQIIPSDSTLNDYQKETVAQNHFLRGDRNNAGYHGWVEPVAKIMIKDYPFECEARYSIAEKANRLNDALLDLSPENHLLAYVTHFHPRDDIPFGDQMKLSKNKDYWTDTEPDFNFDVDLHLPVTDEWMVEKAKLTTKNGLDTQDDYKIIVHTKSLKSEYAQKVKEVYETMLNNPLPWRGDKRRIRIYIGTMVEPKNIENWTGQSVDMTDKTKYTGIIEITGAIVITEVTPEQMEKYESDKFKMELTNFDRGSNKIAVLQTDPGPTSTPYRGVYIEPSILQKPDDQRLYCKPRTLIGDRWTLGTITAAGKHKGEHYLNRDRYNENSREALAIAAVVKTHMIGENVYEEGDDPENRTNKPWKEPVDQKGNSHPRAEMYKPIGTIPDRDPGPRVYDERSVEKPSTSDKLKDRFKKQLFGARAKVSGHSQNFTKVQNMVADSSRNVDSEKEKKSAFAAKYTKLNEKGQKEDKTPLLTKSGREENEELMRANERFKRLTSNENPDTRRVDQILRQARNWLPHPSQSYGVTGDDVEPLLNMDEALPDAPSGALPEVKASKTSSKKGAPPVINRSQKPKDIPTYNRDLKNARGKPVSSSSHKKTRQKYTQLVAE